MRTPRELRLWSARSRQAADKERSSVALALQQAQPDRIDAAFEQRDLRRPGQGHPIALGGRKDRLESARMSEWSSPFLSRTLLRTLSALLTICLLAQFFIAGIAAMTDPAGGHITATGLRSFNGWSFRFRSWRGLAGLLVGGAHYSHAFPCCRSHCNMCWRTAQSKADLRLVWACTPWMPGLLLLIAAGLAVGLFD